MEVSRRSFFKRGILMGAAPLAAAAAQTAHAAGPSGAKPVYKLADVKETTNICCYCSGGCGTICSARNGELINLEGDPDHPVNMGGLCPKGAAMWGLRNIVTPERKAKLHPDRVLTPLVRRPGSKTWEKISWDEAIDAIAKRIKKTRDETFVEKEDGVTVNRCDGIASFGAAQLNNEEGWLVQKFARSLGIVAIDNQTRVCHSSTVSGLAPSFGRGSMTSHWCDFQNSDVILSIGSNNVENHPLSSRWVERAQDRGATWIVVDPRYNRSAANADIYGRIRPGTDIAFYGGLINYILSNDLWQHEYVLNYTNAACLLREDYEFDPESGLFSGWDPETKRYSDETWGYDYDQVAKWDTSETGAYAWVNKPGTPKFKTPDLEVLKRDLSLTDPRCVINVMKRHYARYTPELVAKVTGMDPEVMMKIWQVYASTGRPDRSGSILYALGQTQHTYGSQNCRAMCIVQLLLGNIGVAGGGINALRGEPNVQGSTDVGASVPDAPGYLKWPTGKKHPTLAKYLEAETYAAGYYANKPKFWVSALREWFGENATVENDYCYDLLPKISPKLDYGAYSTIMTFNMMRDERIKGYMCWGMNPAHSAANGAHVRRSMANLDWLLVADWFLTETATFWEAPDMDPEKINTEVFFLPAALIYEKTGSINNSGRWIQWREKAIEPPGECKSDFEMLSLLFERIRSLYEAEGGACPEQVLKANMRYMIDGKYDIRALCWALNGYDVKTKKLLKGYADLQADGSTACGIWIFSGYYNNNDAPLDPMKQPMTRRSKEDPTGLGLYPNWSFAWPANRRILYNRASADPKGRPWNDKRVLVEWKNGKWLQNDVGDFATANPPDNNAFFMTWEQNARLFAYPMVDGPMPEHFEPFESPTANAFNGAAHNPCARFTEDKSVRRGEAGDYPYVCTTYSVTEHWQSGTQTRNIPWLNELVPCNFIELSEELAKEKGIKTGDDVRVWNNRGSVVVKAMVTIRMQPMQVNGKLTHVVGMPHHFSWATKLATGDNVNDLTPNVGDPNSYIPEYKAFLVNIEKAA
ncbi:molybdopterin-dependent oxidoreductase [Sutterella massiliensis]|uniref:Molybdopterin-dependent oxidoreductase n=1 Tax=Sutterella massiliensis TaxID=1816689 RepID=A0ABS2DR75_9BURK|nr:molybdopterin-dependent oxidoreductase [Sutterella massiliensis]MBM6703804.1 molybdopterin-dependent oxidoreductase [Sutterella massiliensis]